MYTDLQPDMVPPATIARIRTCPIPEQPFPHKFTDKTAEGCQVSIYLFILPDLYSAFSRRY